MKVIFVVAALVVAVSASCDQTIDIPSEISSPNYPSNYDLNADCTYTINPVEAVSVEVVAFNVEGYGDYCAYDYVEVTVGGAVMGKYCGLGSSETGLKSFVADKQVVIKFVSDHTISKSGFLLRTSSVATTTAGPTTTREPYVPGDCGVPKITPTFSRIVGGEESKPGSWPWQADVRYNWGFDSYPHSHFCGGTLINDQWVVSAAHCFEGRDKNDYKIMLGQHEDGVQGPETQEFSIGQLIIHEDYTSASTTGYDIALIKLDRPVTFGDRVSESCLPRDDSEFEPTLTCVTTGWGDTMNTGDEKVLNQVRVPVVSTSTCNQQSWYGGSITDTMVCAGLPTGGKDSCQGDSGGPLVCQKDGKYFLVGVTSWGYGCAVAEKPGVYARVTALVNWVNDNVQ